MTTKDYEKKLLNDIVNSILLHDLKKRICSIIVTGSFGRHEETFEFFGNSFKLKSDVEIALVYKKYTTKKYLNVLIENVSSEFEEDLNLMPISQKRMVYQHNFNNSIVSPRFKTLFTYDLFNGSYTIWGDRIIERNKVTLDKVDIYEAKRIVSNRIAEYLYLTNQSCDDYIKLQWQSKIVLAIGSAYLLINNLYSTPFSKQYDILKNNMIDFEKTFGEEFFNLYEKAYFFLRRSGKYFVISENELRKIVLNTNKYFDLKLFNCVPKVNSFSRKLKYLFKYLKHKSNFNVFTFETDIINNIILFYGNNDSRQMNIANLWHNILY